MNSFLNKEKLPTITIITAVYNGGRYLEETIQSVIGQTYSNIEYIIIDGGSKDNTVDIIHKYNSQLHYWISEKDKGVYDAWNKGIAKAGGDWIVFLGADDILASNTIIEECVNDLAQAIKNGIRYVYGKINLLSFKGDKLLTTIGKPWPASKKKVFQYMSVTHCGAFHHKTLFSDYGSFNTDFKIAGDYEFTLREFSRGKEALFIDRVIAIMRIGGLSADLSLKLTVAKENIKALSLNSLPITFHHKVQLIKAHMGNILLTVIGMKSLRYLSDLYRSLKGKDKIWS